MSTPWVRCSRELQSPQWSLAGVLQMIYCALGTMAGRPPRVVHVSRRSVFSHKLTRISRDVSHKRRSHYFCPCVKRRSGFDNTNSEMTTSRERGVVLPQKPSVAAPCQRCFRVSHVFGLSSPRKVDSTDRTHIPGIFRVATNGSNVVAEGGSNVLYVCR